MSEVIIKIDTGYSGDISSPEEFMLWLYGIPVIWCVLIVLFKWFIW